MTYKIHRCVRLTDLQLERVELSLHRLVNHVLDRTAHRVPGPVHYQNLDQVGIRPNFDPSTSMPFASVLVNRPTKLDPLVSYSSLQDFNAIRTSPISS